VPIISATQEVVAGGFCKFKTSPGKITERRPYLKNKIELRAWLKW
jgi:hypothetical protein